jgi:hypothetical protein
MHILVGSFGGLAGLMFFGLFAGPATASAYGPLVGYTITGWMVLLLVLAIPTIALGVGLIKYRPWARVGGAVIAIIELLNFPLGTLLGVYALWVLLAPEADPLFNRRFH